jgi:large conductance mechanosensitive channel
MLKEFKAFAMRGNLIDIAVGLILALAFSAVVNAFVDGIVLNLIAAILGEPSFDSIVWTIGDGSDATTIEIGRFITALVNFVLIAFVLFWIVKVANRYKKPVDEEAGPTEIQLLTEVRDVLRRST